MSAPVLAIITDLVQSADEPDNPSEIVQVWSLAEIGTTNITHQIICKQEFALHKLILLMTL